MSGVAGETTTEREPTRTEMDTVVETPSEALGDPLIGSILGGFRVDDVLGAGGNGVVYRAWDTRLDRPVALKVMRFDGATARVRFRKEARSQGGMRHPNVVAVHAIEEIGGLTCLVMDIAPGGSVAGLLARQGRLPEARAIAIVRAVASALDAARARGLVHRDVKPSNILLEADGRPMLSDFGLAKEVAPRERDPDAPALSAAPRSFTHGVVGTPAYLAPEQARGERVDHRADIYALGVTLYELLTAKRPPPMPISSSGEHLPEPPEPEAVSAIVPAVRPEVEAIVTRMIRRDPAQRYGSYAELIADLDAAGAAPSRAAPATPALRAAAFVVDAFLLTLVLAGVVMLANRLLTATGARSDATESIVLVAAWVSGAIALGLVEARWGATPGKRLLDLRLEGPRGASCPPALAAVRSLVRFAPFYVTAPMHLAHLGHSGWVIVALSVALALPAARADRLALHDRITRTRVVRGASK
jgi:uncharacterized RDD family membrane protein YckC